MYIALGIIIGILLLLIIQLRKAIKTQNEIIKFLSEPFIEADFDDYDVSH